MDPWSNRNPWAGPPIGSIAVGSAGSMAPMVGVQETITTVRPASGSRVIINSGPGQMQMGSVLPAPPLGTPPPGPPPSSPRPQSSQMMTTVVSGVPSGDPWQNRNPWGQPPTVPGMNMMGPVGSVQVQGPSMLLGSMMPPPSPPPPPQNMSQMNMVSGPAMVQQTVITGGGQSMIDPWSNVNPWGNPPTASPPGSGSVLPSPRGPVASGMSTGYMAQGSNMIPAGVLPLAVETTKTQVISQQPMSAPMGHSSFSRTSSPPPRVVQEAVKTTVIAPGAVTNVSGLGIGGIGSLSNDPWFNLNPWSNPPTIPVGMGMNMNQQAFGNTMMTTQPPYQQGFGGGSSRVFI